VSERIGNARYEFFGRFLGGQPEPRPRWKRGVSTVNVFLADAIGRLYVEGTSARTSRPRVQRIAEQVLRAYRDAVSGLDWPTSRAKVEAQSRIATVAVKVGAPDVWRDYGRLVIKADDLFGNALRTQKFENDRRMAQAGAPAAAGEWPLGPQTVNAFYNAAANEVLVPAALLQPPYFDADADEAVNFGAIGAVIAHEIGHALDVVGRRIPAGLTLEGANDATGLAVALDAYHRSLGGKTPATIDGLTGDQRFFLGWARIWREIVRPEYARQLAITNLYPGGAMRANGPLRQSAAFRAAFAIR
jgi:predicted metalloendopeptidase